MPILSGVRLGSYEVLELIGMGGMGEVYRARDARLNRDVAVKILPSHVAADPDRLARFRREAQVLASLNHPGIGAIYGFEESAGVQALILELVDGPTLGDRIAQGPIPLDEALPITVQIAHALEAAHERGIVHRDLKPANIKVRPDGAVKVLDFGLAKAFVTDDVTADAAASPTITSPALTRLGMILGTAAYMSPEQARGKDADKRSDIWAFGCVLYEMLSAKRAFDGSEVSDTLASILKSDPDWSALPGETPPAIRRLLRRCLEKDSRRRLHDIADVRIELEEPVAQDAATMGASHASKSRARERAAWVLAALSLASTAGLLGYVSLKPAPVREVTRFQVYPPAGPESGGRGESYLSVSPDGTRLVFVAPDRTGKDMLWLRDFDAFDPVPLAGTEGASFPFWEPHGASIAFFAGRKLMGIPAAGGSPHTISDDVIEPRGGTWGAGGDIVFSSGISPRLYRVDADGGTPVPLATQAGPATVDARWPYFLPDGRTFLYYARNQGVYAASIASDKAPKMLLTSDSQAAFDPSGFLLFTRGGALLRRRFDPARLEVSGEARRVAERVALVQGLGLAAFSVSNTGVLAFQPGALSTQFAWVDRTGHVLETVGPPGSYRSPSLSPDGKRLVYLDVSDGTLWTLDMGRHIASRFMTGPGLNFCPVWSSDGGTILYRRDIGSEVGVYQRSTGGAGEETLLFKSGVACPSQVSRDGKWLLYFAVPEGESTFDIYVLPMTGDRTPHRVVQSPLMDYEPQFSPDGRFVAYSSNVTGRGEVYVQAFPATGQPQRVSTEGGRQPLWREDGRELFFVNDDRKFYAVPIKPGPTFDYGTPQVLFDMHANLDFARNSYIPSPDGQRFLVNMSLDTAAPPIHVVRNWTAGLKD